MVTENRQTEWCEFGKLTARGALLLAPFLLWQVLEVFVLPLDAFTFRAWEAALATPYRYPGPYYPEAYIDKPQEYGDRFRSGDPAAIEAKPVKWFVDGYGWRNRPEIERANKYDVIMLGDSNVVGSFLDQKDTLTEVFGALSGTVAYSYSYGADHISLMFSDPRIREKRPDLLVVETKAGAWDTNSGYLSNFREGPGGELEIIDRSKEFERNFYAPRNFPIERLHSRLVKQPMYYWMRSAWALDFSPSADVAKDSFMVTTAPQSDAPDAVWAPLNWITSASEVQPIGERSATDVRFRAKQANAFWHTGAFRSTRQDGRVTIKFKARATISTVRHRMHIFEDGSYRSIGEFTATSRWRDYAVPIKTNPGALLEFQIDQPVSWQWLEVMDFQVEDGRPPFGVAGGEIALPMEGWNGGGAPCTGQPEATCRRWEVPAGGGYVQSPVVPATGSQGIRIYFEARADTGVPRYADIYLFEGDKYRRVAQASFGESWKTYEWFVPADAIRPLKVQVDLPVGASSLAIRNARVSVAVEAGR